MTTSSIPGGGGVGSGGHIKLPKAKDGEKYCLKWHTFQSFFAGRLKVLFAEGDVEEMDVVLSAEGHFIRAHKWLLSLCSSYFKELFNASPSKKSNNFVVIPSVKFRDLRNLIYFLYNGEVKVATSEELQGFIKIGELLQVEGLSKEDNTSTPAPETAAAPTPTASTSSTATTTTTTSCDTTNQTVPESHLSTLSSAVAVASSSGQRQRSHGQGPSRPSTSSGMKTTRDAASVTPKCPPTKRQKISPGEQQLALRTSEHSLDINLLQPEVVMNDSTQQEMNNDDEHNYVESLYDPLAIENEHMDDGEGNGGEVRNPLFEADLNFPPGDAEMGDNLIEVTPSFIKNETDYEENNDEDDSELGNDESDLQDQKEEEEEKYETERSTEASTPKPGPSKRRIRSTGPRPSAQKARRPKSVAGSKLKLIRNVDAAYGPKNSPVRKYFSYISKGCVGNSSTCKICGVKSSTFTTGMWYHLKRYHPKQAKAAKALKNSF